MPCKLVPRTEISRAQPLSWRAVPRTAFAPVAPAAPAQAAAEAECERRVEEARAAGFREGEAAAGAHAREEVEAAAERFARAAGELAGLKPRLRREAQSDILQLALAIARRILHRELAIDPDALRGIVEAALARLEGQEIGRVRVHPADEVPVRKCLDKFGSRVAVSGEPALERGAVIFESARGNLDASIDTQLEEIGRGLADRLRGMQR